MSFWAFQTRFDRFRFAKFRFEGFDALRQIVALRIDGVDGLIIVH